MSTTLNAVLVTTDGNVTPVEINSDDGSGFLGELYGLLVCDTVEAVSINRGLTAWVDGEGLYQQEPNRVASAICCTIYRCAAAAHLHGPVVFTGGIGPGGSETSISTTDARQIAALAGLASGIGGAA